MIILLRHGQSRFNVWYDRHQTDPGLADPALTPLGIEQVHQAAAALVERRVERIHVSPYTRTLQTAAILAQRLGLASLDQVVVDPALRERRYYTCDVGTARAALVARWPAFTFPAFPETWWAAEREPRDAFAARCAPLRARLAALPCTRGRCIVVVTHTGIIEQLTGQHLGNAAMCGFDPSA